jgi:nucleotide-binding universal stress UspA family protein
MFNRILLPLDGSALAEGAIPHALALAQLADAEIIVLHVIEESGAEPGVDPIEWHLRKAAVQTYLDALCAKVKAVGVRTQCLLLAGSPADRIVEQVDMLGIDLVLISSHGQSERTDWALGAVAYKVLEAVGTSVMLVRNPAAPDESRAFVPAHYRTLMVSLDGSRRAECILPIAERLMEQQHAGLVLAHIVQRPGLLGWAMLAEDERRLAEQLIEHTATVAQQYLGEIQARHGEHATVVLSQADNVATELNEIAMRHAVDLILVSAHGAAANPRRSFGDTVIGVLTYCRQPVLIYQDQPGQRASIPEAAPLRGRHEEPDDRASLAA